MSRGTCMPYCDGLPGVALRVGFGSAPAIARSACAESMRSRAVTRSGLFAIARATRTLSVSGSLALGDGRVPSVPVAACADAAVGTVLMATSVAAVILARTTRFCHARLVAGCIGWNATAEPTAHE